MFQQVSTQILLPNAEGEGEDEIDDVLGALIGAELSECEVMKPPKMEEESTEGKEEEITAPAGDQQIGIGSPRGRKTPKGRSSQWHQQWYGSWKKPAHLMRQMSIM